MTLTTSRTVSRRLSIDFPDASCIVFTDIRKILLAIHKECSPKKRPIHAHTTCATVSHIYTPSFGN